MTIRDTEARIKWFDDHRPDEVGMCANYTWRSFGGLPAWNTSDANAVVEKAKRSGVLHTSTHPPRGAIVLWTSHTHGHMCLSLGGDMIISTDYPNARDTGEAHISMPHTKWGHTYAGWLDSYAGVSFDVGGAVMSDEYGLDGDNKQLVVGREYVRFSTNWNPRTDGLQLAKRYSKCKPVFATGKTSGSLRFKAVRTNPEDPTFYHDEGVSADMLDEDGFFLRSFSSFESGEASRDLYWMVKCIGGMKSCTITDSHYAGFAVQD